MINAMKKIKVSDGIKWLGEVPSWYRLIRQGFCEQVTSETGLQRQICKNLEKAHCRRGIASAKALRQSKMCLRNRVKSGWRLLSIWDMVSHASGRIKKSQILRGSIAHSKGFEFYAIQIPVNFIQFSSSYTGSHWKILSRIKMIPFVF